jgi:5-bromo-4-chloroindolyl phosphate hydrolysis protein
MPYYIMIFVYQHSLLLSAIFSSTLGFIVAIPHFILDLEKKAPTDTIIVSIGVLSKSPFLDILKIFPIHSKKIFP